jgi:ribosomal protein L35
MSVKTNKSYTKRLKLTGTGKVLARKPGFNHFNAKQSRTTQLAGKKMVDFKISAKDLGRFIPHQ